MVIRSTEAAMAAARALTVATVFASLFTAAADEIYGPKLMAYQGCSISSSTYHVGRALLEAHTGRHAMRFRMEQLRIQKNLYADLSYGLNTIAAAVDAEIVSTIVHGGLFFSKIEYYKLEHQSEPELMKVLHYHGARVVNTYRSNSLDFLICLIRDCFGAKSVGYPVLEDGTPTDICFERRKEGSPKVYAYIHVDQLRAALEKFLRQAENQERGLRNAGFLDFDTIATEDLMAFAMSEAGMEPSTDAWCRYLVSLGVQPDRQLIQQVLRGEHSPATEESCHGECVPAAHPVTPHADSIYNIEEVANALREFGNQTYLSLLRHRFPDTEMR